MSYVLGGLVHCEASVGGVTSISAVAPGDRHSWMRPFGGVVFAGDAVSPRTWMVAPKIPQNCEPPESQSTSSPENDTSLPHGPASPLERAASGVAGELPQAARITTSKALVMCRER